MTWRPRPWRCVKVTSLNAARNRKRRIGREEGKAACALQTTCWRRRSIPTCRDRARASTPRRTGAGADVQATAHARIFATRTGAGARALETFSDLRLRNPEPLPRRPLPKGLTSARPGHSSVVEGSLGAQRTGHPGLGHFTPLSRLSSRKEDAPARRPRGPGPRGCARPSRRGPAGRVSAPRAPGSCVTGASRASWPRGQEWSLRPLQTRVLSSGTERALVC